MLTPALLLLAAPPAGKAFLDSPSAITAVLNQPLTREAIARGFALEAGGRTIARMKGEPLGDPERRRVLPLGPDTVTLPGTLQAALGGREWDPADESTQMVQAGPGVYVLAVRLPAGDYQYKAARGGSWGENYGEGFRRDGGNLSLTVPAGGAFVAFRVDFSRREILNSLQNPDRVPPPSAPTRSPRPEEPRLYSTVRLASPLSLSDLAHLPKVAAPDGSRLVLYARDVLKNLAYDDRQGPLGASVEKGSTVFRTWSPVSAGVTLLLGEGASIRKIAMKRLRTGGWKAVVPGSLHGRPYRYEFDSYGQKRPAADIHGWGASADSRHSVVVDFSRVGPKTTQGPRLAERTDSFIYEAHVRDLTIDPSSGAPAPLRGTYLGLARTGSMKTGLGWIRSLGVTDLHLLPMQDFPTGPKREYSWGYVTSLFNVPESSYSVSASPVGVAGEFREMVNAAHKAGLRLVMDVVYNHTWPPEGPDSAFEQTIPFFYFRTDDRGRLLNESGVGNALADERLMVRRFVRDSLLHWMKDYGVDGFRFDLLGMHLPESVREWTAAVRRFRPDATLYGEPWTGGGPTRFPKGAQKGMGIAVFNDDFRNVFRGELDGSAPGFIAGGGADMAALRSAVSGSASTFALDPSETVNYVSAHDNMTLRDRIAASLPGRPDRQKAALRLAAGAVLLSRGIPFWEGGAEMGRTKGGSHNSYSLGDAVNSFRWGGARDGIGDWLRGLASLRRACPVLRSPQARTDFTSFPRLPDRCAAWTLKGPGMKTLAIVLNGSLEKRTIALPPGRWEWLARGGQAGAEPLGPASSPVAADFLSANVLIQK